MPGIVLVVAPWQHELELVKGHCKGIIVSVGCGNWATKGLKGL
jgi:hypothetical protein